MTDRNEIITAHPIATFLERRGIKLRGSTPKLVTNRCPNLEHKNGHFCVTVNIDENWWHCNDCDIKGTVIDWIMFEQGITAGEALRQLDPHANADGPKSSPKAKAIPEQPTDSKINPADIEATYDYTDELGRLIYQVVRLKPLADGKKRFRQRRPHGKGWIDNMDGVVRTLFNLAAVLTNQEVSIAEGEKDCLTLGKLGYTATCNTGGALKWCAAYSDLLEGKDICIFGDNDYDRKGETHVEQILSTLRGKANSIKWIPIPAIYKDVTQFIESFPDTVTAAAGIEELIKSTPYLLKPAPLFVMPVLEANYRDFINRSSEISFDLGKFLPSLGKAASRPLTPGEVLLLVGDTGIGKTILAQSLARAARPLKTLFFELELPGHLIFERFVQMERGCYAHDVEDDYRNEPGLTIRYPGLEHIVTCAESGLTLKQIEEYIIKSELVFGQPCNVVVIDYIGLVRGPGKSRYEMLSNIAEGLKIIAKKTATIMIEISQCGRPDKKKTSGEIGLHDAKDSGAVENSAGLVVGCWRPMPDEIHLRINKATKGASNATIEANFDGAKMQITEMD